MNKSLTVMCVVLAANLISCKAKTADAPVDPGVSAGGGSSGGVTTPTYGMSCSGNGAAGWNDAEATPAFTVPTINGNFVTSVTLKLKLSPGGGSPGPALFSNTAISRSMTLTAYTCGTASSLGSQVATASASPMLYGANSSVTFTFASPLAMPSAGACAGGNNLVFKIGGGTNSGYILNIYGYATGGACTDRLSDSATAIDFASFSRSPDVTVNGTL